MPTTQFHSLHGHCDLGRRRRWRGSVRRAAREWRGRRADWGAGDMVM